MKASNEREIEAKDDRSAHTDIIMKSDFDNKDVIPKTFSECEEAKGGRSVHTEIIVKAVNGDKNIVTKVFNDRE